MNLDNPKNTKRIQGFGLIEVMIALAVTLVVVGIGIAWLDAERKRTARGDAIAMQALEMATIGRALDQFLRDDYELPSDGSTVEVTFDELSAARLLPEHYADRGLDGAPTSPLGQSYTMLARIDGGVSRGVVITGGAPSTSSRARLGIRASPRALADLQGAAVRQMRTQHYVASALVEAGSTAAHRTASGFVYDFAPFIGAPFEDAAAVALVGFPEFSASADIKVRIDPDSLPGGGDGGGTGGEGSLVGRECYLQRDSSCGSDQEVWRHKTCDSWTDEPFTAGTRDTAVSLGSSTARVSRLTAANVYASGPTLTAHGYETSGRIAEWGEYFDSWSNQWYSYIMERPLRLPGAPYRITDDISGTTLRAPSDHYYALGTFDTTEVGDILGRPVSSASGAVWRKATDLQACGADGEIDTSVYEITTGDFVLHASGRGSHPAMRAPAQAMSVIDPNRNGGIPALTAFWVETLTIDGTTANSQICAGKWLSNSSVSSMSFAVTWNPLAIRHAPGGNEMHNTYACPKRRGVADGNVINSNSVAPLRAFGRKNPNSSTYRYCCKR